jgi:hypothetical protein
VPSLATASLDAAERRALQRFVGLLRKRFTDDLDAVWLYGPRVRGEPPQDESELQLLVSLRHSSRSDRVTALELLWQAALAERATEATTRSGSPIEPRPSAGARSTTFSRARSSPTGSLSSPARGRAPELARRARARRLPSPEPRSGSAGQGAAGRAFPGRISAGLARVSAAAVLVEVDADDAHRQGGFHG